MRCLWLFHRWMALKHGPSFAPYPDWDARECSRCGRFEVIVYGNWHRSTRAACDNVRAA